MKVKVSEASGVVLDWMVAKCEGYNRYSPNNHNFSTCWNKGGPIIERECITLGKTPTWQSGVLELSNYWMAYQPATLDDDDAPDSLKGKTPLEAAMRCYVASRLGNEVEVPEELVS